MRCALAELRLLPILVAILVQSGCGQIESQQVRLNCGPGGGLMDRMQEGEWIEMASPCGWHVLLSARRGCCAVFTDAEVSAPSAQDERLHVLVPASPSEILAMIGVLDAAKVYEPGIGRIRLERGLIHGPPRVLTVRWAYKGRVDLVNLPWERQEVAGLWNGIAEELGNLGSSDVARAVLSQLSADRLATAGNLREACERYKDALHLLFRWTALRERVQMRPGVLYEPELLLAEPAFAYQNADYAKAWEAYHALWERRLSVTHDSGILVVRFKEVFAKEVRLPAEVSQW